MAGAVLALASAIGLALAARGQEARPAQPAVTKDRFEFEVIESFDAKYLGDTPGHRGRNGGLESIQPHVALGDYVLRDKQRVGRVTGLLWDRTKASLDVEFDPLPLQRVRVGDVVWVRIDPGPHENADKEE